MNRSFHIIILCVYLFSLCGWCDGATFRICEDGVIEPGAGLYGCDADRAGSATDESREAGIGLKNYIQATCDDVIPSSNYLNEKNPLYLVSFEISSYSAVTPRFFDFSPEMPGIRAMYSTHFPAMDVRQLKNMFLLL